MLVLPRPIIVLRRNALGTCLNKTVVVEVDESVEWFASFAIGDPASEVVVEILRS